MNFSAFTTRHWISIGLCVLGFLIPVLVVVYWFIRYPGFTNHFFWVQVFEYQWLPITSLLWLAAGFVYPNDKWRLVAWIAFGLGILLSVVSYIFYRVNRQY